MPRKLIPLTDKIINSESFCFSRHKEWKKEQESEANRPGKKVRTIISKLNGMNNTKNPCTSGSQKRPRDQEVTNIKEKSSAERQSRNGKRCKTISEQKILAREREQKALEMCRAAMNCNLNESENQKSSEAESSQSLGVSYNGSDESMSTTIGKSGSFIKFNDSKIAMKSSNESQSERVSSVTSQQSFIEGNKIKVYRCGDKLFAKTSVENNGDCNDCNDSNRMKKIHMKNCCRQVKVSKKSLDIFKPQKKRNTLNELTLGKPFGIQHGSLSISNDYFPIDSRNKQALDVLFVAHGMTHFKPLVQWSQCDIDNVLMIGTDLQKETKDVNIDKLSTLTKGFTYQNYFIQVTMSEPIIVGKIVTISDRSMDLYRGLRKFFSQHQHGFLQVPNFDLYIVKSEVFLVFDPRGRTMNCERSENGEAALMALLSLDNLYHLILNLSDVNITSPFKLSSVDVSLVTSSDNSPEKFIVVSGNPARSCRSDDFKILTNEIVFLQGSLHYESKVFEKYCNKQALTSSIMAMVYAKIDPPNTWSTPVFDRILHFGAKLFITCLEDGPIRNLTLSDVPSKFYVGDSYQISIAIAAFLKRVKIQAQYSICDNEILQELRNNFETTSFKNFLLQVDKNYFAVWHMKSIDVFCFFDGYQKDLEGNLDRYEGKSSLFISDNLEKLCEIIINRLLLMPRSSDAELCIHGMKILEHTKLNEMQQRCKPKLCLKKVNCVKPMTPEDAKVLQDSPSSVDSVTPIVDRNQIKAMREKLPEKPQHQKVTNLNSPSLVCCKVKIYEDIMTEVEKKLSFVPPTEFSPENVALVHKMHSEILRNVIEDEKSKTESDETNVKKRIIKPCGCEINCGVFVTCADKIWPKSRSKRERSSKNQIQDSPATESGVSTTSD